MASTVARATEKNTNVNYVLTLLKAKPGEKHTGKEICEHLGITMNAKGCMMLKLMKKHPEIRYSRSKGVGSYYWWEEPVGKKEKPVEDKYPAPKNNEGYLDTTASTAIDKVDLELEKNAALPKFGDIMRARHSSGETPLFFVLWSTETYATGIYVLEDDGTIVKSKSTISLKLDDKPYIMITTNVFSKPVKYLIKKAFTAGPATMVQVKHRVADNLDIQPKVVEKEKIVEKPVEKIVYKDRTVYKEKPVEKIVYKDRPEVPEGYISKADAVISDLLHQLDIYKDMVNRLAPLK